MFLPDYKPMHIDNKSLLLGSYSIGKHGFALAFLS